MLEITTLLIARIIATCFSISGALGVSHKQQRLERLDSVFGFLVILFGVLMLLY